MLLKNLFDKEFDTESLRGMAELSVSNICHKIEDVKQGDVFFALSDNFEKSFLSCQESVKKGCVAVVSQFDMPFENSIKVQNARRMFALCCANFYQRACDKMKIVGISGTNGKTTTSHVVAEILKRNDKKVGIIGTNGVFFNGKTIDCPLTTPDADFLHKTFKQMYENGVEYVVMEVSAHAIVQNRIDGINFEIGVLTNITQDHLDYFHTMENYQKAKFSFFSSDHIKKAVVCVDDERARKLVEECQVDVVTYGINCPSDVFAIDVCCSINGSQFVGNVCDNFVEIKTNLVGKYNVYNALASLAVCHLLGLDAKQMTRGLNFINPVEGRFNVVNLSGVYVVIDYAHSPDGLKQVLNTARTLTDKNLYVVFGCGGNRDTTKRADMGKIASEIADFVCLTDDNPRMEDSMDIIKDIEKGIKKPHFVEPDRATAIEKMLKLAKKGDIIIIAGKGAEKYQEIGTKKIAYNDFDVVYNHYKKSNPFVSKGREFYDC